LKIHGIVIRLESGRVTGAGGRPGGQLVAGLAALLVEQAEMGAVGKLGEGMELWRGGVGMPVDEEGRFGRGRRGVHAVALDTRAGGGYLVEDGGGRGNGPA